MTDVKVTNTRKISGSSLTVQNLRDLISGVDGSCKVLIQHHRSLDQREAEYDSITILDVKEQRITRGDGGVVPR